MKKQIGIGGLIAAVLTPGALALNRVNTERDAITADVKARYEIRLNQAFAQIKDLEEQLRKLKDKVYLGKD